MCLIKMTVTILASDKCPVYTDNWIEFYRTDEFVQKEVSALFHYYGVASSIEGLRKSIPFFIFSGKI